MEPKIRIRKFKLKGLQCLHTIQFAEPQQIGLCVGKTASRIIIIIFVGRRNNNNSVRGSTCWPASCSANLIVSRVYKLDGFTVEKIILDH